MKPPHRKKAHYEQLMVRMTKAIAAEFYLEASWYAYAILEDRAVTALKASGGAHGAKGKPIKMLGPKISMIKERRKKDSLLRVYFDSNLMDDLVAWKEERNALIHAMANAKTSLQSIDKQAFLLATRGKALVKAACRATRQLKRNRHKIPVS